MADLQSEILAIKQLIDKQAENDMKPIVQGFKKSLDSVRLEIAKLYAKYGDLSTMSGAERTKELKQLESFILEQIKNLNIIESTKTKEILNKSFSESYYRTFFTVQTGVISEIPFKVLSNTFVESIVNQKFKGKRFSDRIWTNKKLLVNRLNKIIKSGVIQGKSIDKMAKDIKDIFGQSAYISKRLIHTETARVQSEASDKVYKDSGVVQKVMYDATLDNKTSEKCRDLDGKIFDINSNYPKPPQHPNCRSAIIPIIDGWKPRTKRNNITKEIVPYKTYDEWAKEKGID